MNDVSAPRRCIVCDIAPQSSIILPKGVRLLRCPRCELAWWDWPPFEPAAFYDRDYFQSDREPRGYNDYESLEIGLRRTARARLRRIERVMVQSGGARLGERRLLDVGCGTGVFLDEARHAGWDVRGIEISRYAVDEARRRGLSITHAIGDDLRLEPATYECITFWDVIEHVRDPRGLLANAGRALVPGGVLALSTGDVTSLCARLCGARWHLFNLPEHLFFFSPRSLRKLFRRVGCGGVCVSREINWVPLSYLLERVAKSIGWGTRRRGGGRWVLPATLGDVLGAYAVRTANVPGCPARE